MTSAADNPAFEPDSISESPHLFNAPSSHPASQPSNDELTRPAGDLTHIPSSQELASQDCDMTQILVEDKLENGSAPDQSTLIPKQDKLENGSLPEPQLNSDFVARFGLIGFVLNGGFMVLFF